MKKYLILTILFSTVFTITGCSNAQDIPKKNEVVEEQKISLSDDIIIQKYRTLMNDIDIHNPKSKEKLKNILLDVKKIQAQNEREKIEMNIYLSLEMYQEAYELNKKQLNERPTQAKLFKHCELMQILKYPQNDLRSCQSKVAEGIRNELKTIPKDDPAYPYAKWGYLLAMYKSGHGEYKEQMEKFINSTTDETMKFQFQGSYEMAIESNN